MTMLHERGRRPWPVALVASVFALAGIVGLTYHAIELRRTPIDGAHLWVLALRGMAIAIAVGLIRGARWSRWLALAWMAYHVGLSAFHSVGETATHGALLVVIAALLFSPPASRFFRGVR